MAGVMLLNMAGPLKSKKSPAPHAVVPSIHDWRTTDEDEINRRKERAQSEFFKISNLTPEHPVFSIFKVHSSSGMDYLVEIRDIKTRQFACECVDFRINGLGTCKHVEAVLMQIQRRFPQVYAKAIETGSRRIDMVRDVENGAIRLMCGRSAMPKFLRAWFDENGSLVNGSPEDVVAELEALPRAQRTWVRLSLELKPWLESRARVQERKELRREYELKVQRGEWPASETKVPLFPYQREGMLHLAFSERALLADEMGLGKTIQAIAACALLHRLGKAQHVLVVTPASLKTEWEDQIQRFTGLPYQLVFGSRSQRLKAYEGAPFFTIVNYEQMLADTLDVNERLHPDVVVLDEAQRIKNWSAKTTQAIKRLRSRYAFVLTGTPIENRIDELYSLMDFLDPSLLGPLFRFNREYYQLDERGRPAGYRNLQKLHDRISPYMLRRRKSDVETELPERTDRNHFVALSSEQKSEYGGLEEMVAKFASMAKRRPLTKQEQDKLLQYLNMMRMVCDTGGILNPDLRACPKLDELEKILEECRENPDVKLIIFSEWERMLARVRELCNKLGMGFAWHTGSVPQKRRRAEINAFKSDPACRVFLSTDSGATGLNLQNASVVINCDLPWNPAKLEQRIARAWRKHQTRPVTVINLVSENTIEHRMLETLSNKQALSEGVLDLKGNLDEIKLRSGRQAFLAKLEQMISPVRPKRPETTVTTPLPTDRPLGFAQAAHQQLNGAMISCEERYPQDGPHSVLYVIVDHDAVQWREKLNRLHGEFFGPGKYDPLSPVRLEVVDRATDEILNRLVETGLIARTARAARPLWPADASLATPMPLSESERVKAAGFRQQAARKLKMAAVLSAGGFDEEAHAALSDAILPLARALAVEKRLPEPATQQEAMIPPMAPVWGNTLASLRGFSSTSQAPIGPLIQQLQKF
jgi:ERCC4-related helicase